MYETYTDPSTFLVLLAEQLSGSPAIRRSLLDVCLLVRVLEGPLPPEIYVRWGDHAGLLLTFALESSM